MSLETSIEAVLFWKGEPVALSTLAKMLGKTKEEIIAGLDVLEKNLAGRGIVLQRNEDQVQLATHPETSELIEALTKEELSSDLSKASIETLSIILYRGPVSRRDIDYIRGVNSQFILRNLMIRGLVEKVSNPNDQRSFIYKPTFELLSYLGVQKIEDLPEYDQVQNELKQAVAAAEEVEAKENQQEATAQEPAAAPETNEPIQ